MRPWLFALALLVSPAARADLPFDFVVAMQNLRAGRDADALYSLNRAIGEHGLKGGELADVLEWRAFLHAKRNDHRAARADLDAAIAAEQENPLRHRARARFFLRTGDYRAALADMETVMGRSPTDAENYTDYCEALLRVGRRREAAEQCRKAVQVNPEYARAREMLRRAGGG